MSYKDEAYYWKRRCMSAEHALDHHNKMLADMRSELLARRDAYNQVMEQVGKLSLYQINPPLILTPDQMIVHPPDIRSKWARIWEIICE